MVTDERAERAAGVVDAVDTTGTFDDWYVDARPKVVAAVALWSGALVPGPATELFHLVAELPPRQRRIVLLRHVVDLTQEEIADALEIKRSTVSSTLTDAHRRLRSLLDDAPTEGDERAQ